MVFFVESTTSIKTTQLFIELPENLISFEEILHLKLLTKLNN